MSELIHELSTEYVTEDGERFVVRVLGERRMDGLWEGWIVFAPVSGGAEIVTDRETEQSEREDLEYWAGGLGDAYLEGALDRARRAESGA